jgi:serine/threonine protein kinase
MEEILGNRYQVQKLLGKQVSHRTFLAFDLQTKQQVVIKLLLFDTDIGWEYLKLFEREAETLQSLEFTAIPRYLNYLELDFLGQKGFALVQTYIDAPSLAEVVEGGRSFAETELKQLAKATLTILTYLHERHPPVIHRDLKPSNILIANRSGNSVGDIYLVDFGSVQTLIAAEGSKMTLVGTYGYMPPEQFYGKASAASDLYSLGATLIYLVTGKQPSELLQNEEEFGLKIPEHSNLNANFAAWLQKLIEVNPKQRFASARIAIEALENCDSIVIEQNKTRLPQPAKSKVILNKNSQQLEVIIPPSSLLQPSILFLLPFAIAWNSFIAFWTYGALFMGGFTPERIFFGLFSLPFWVVGLGMIGGIIFGIWGTIYLQIDQEKISLIYQVFNLKFQKPHPSDRYDINKLVYTQRIYRRDSEGDRVEVPPKIIIWVGVKKYELTGLSEPELDWLAQEIAAWLNLELESA